MNCTRFASADDPGSCVGLIQPANPGRQSGCRFAADEKDFLAALGTCLNRKPVRPDVLCHSLDGILDAHSFYL